MGQKVHPTGFRLGYTKTWRSRWYADKDYAELLHEDLKLKRDLKKVKRFKTDWIFADKDHLPHAPDTSPSQAAISKERLEQLKDVLECFPETQQQVMIMRIRDEMGFEEIGRIIGKSEAATRVLYGRCLKKIVDSMRPPSPDTDSF